LEAPKQSRGGEVDVVPTTGTHACLRTTLRTLSARTVTASSPPSNKTAIASRLKFKLAVDKGNAAALVSFLVFDAIADTKIRRHDFGAPC
jgi:hypothetical protein